MSVCFLSFVFSYASNIEIIFDFSDIITKIHPPFQNPGSALVCFLLLFLVAVGIVRHHLFITYY